MHLPDFVFRRDGVSMRPYRCALPTKNDDLHFKRFFQCFVFLIDVPSGKKGRKFLINVPFVRFSLFTYPPARFFRNYVFLRAPSAGAGGVWPQGYVDKEPSLFFAQQSNGLLQRWRHRAG